MPGHGVAGRLPLRAIRWRRGGFPARFRIRVCLRTPQMPRLSAASGVFFEPSKRMRSATPSSRRSQTARVASGVTSRSAIPVPPVVTTRRALPASWRIAIWMLAWSSETISDAHYRKIPLLQNLRNRRPGQVGALAARCRITDGEDGRGENLRSRGGHLPLLPRRLRHRAWIRRACAGLP